MVVEGVFDHILFVVKNLERSIEFYKILGFKHIETIQRTNDQVSVMQMGPIKIEMICLPEGKETYRPPRKKTDIGFRHIGIRVDDVKKVYEQLKDNIEFDSPPRQTLGRQGRMTVFFKDPDGTEVHFVQD